MFKGDAPEQVLSSTTSHKSGISTVHLHPGTFVFVAKALDDPKLRALLRRLGNSLRGVRKSAHLTQAELAKLSGVGRMTVIRYEAGEISKMSELLRMQQAISGHRTARAKKAGVTVAARAAQALEEFEKAALEVDTLALAADATDESDEARSDIIELGEILRSLPPALRRELYGLIKGYALAAQRRHKSQ